MAEHLFISYSRRDIDFAREVARHLKEAQFKFWIDWEIPVASEWTAAIDKAMRDSYTVVVILSPDSAISQHVNYEIGFASALRLKIIPLQYKAIDGTSPVPQIARINWLDFSKNRNQPWDKLVEALKQSQQTHHTTMGRISRVMQDFFDLAEVDECKKRLLNLVQFMEHDPTAYSELVNALEHPMRDVRLYVLALLVENTNHKDTRAVEALQHLLEKPNEHPAVRREAVRVLAKVGAKAAPILAPYSHDEDTKVMQAASKALQEMGGESVPHVLQTLEFSATRENERRVLTWLFNMGRAAVPHLLNSIYSERRLIRETAATALRTNLEEGIPALIDAARSTDKTARLTALRALGVKDDQRALRVLLNAMNDPDVDIRVVAAKALGETEEESIVPYLFRAAFDRDEKVRVSAYNALRDMGDYAISGLVDNLLDGRDAAQRKTAASLLRDICHVDTIPALLEALNDSVVDVRTLVCTALVCFGETVTPELISILNNHADKRAPAAAWTLQEIGDLNAGPALIHALSDRRSPVALRKAAAEALGRLEYVDAFVELRRVLGDRDIDLQRTAAEALKRLGTLEARSAYDSWKQKRRLL